MHRCYRNSSQLKVRHGRIFLLHFLNQKCRCAPQSTPLKWPWRPLPAIAASTWARVRCPPSQTLRCSTAWTLRNSWTVRPISKRIFCGSPSWGGSEDIWRKRLYLGRPTRGFSPNQWSSGVPTSARPSMCLSRCDRTHALKTLSWCLWLRTG